MTDYFAVAGLPRRPVVDEVALQANYLRRAAAWHPDSPGGDVEKFRELQEARRVLADPAARLKHLLELEGHLLGGGGGQGAPELFLEVAGVLEDVRKLRTTFAASRSAIGRATLESERLRTERKIAGISGRIAGEREALLEQIRLENSRWPEADFARLEKIGKNFVFLSKWSNELRESLFYLQNQAPS